jgi:DnaJ-class molecular chaperone
MKDKICPQCNGNGFIKLLLEEGRESVVTQCNLCNSEGEVYDKEFDEYFDSYPELKSLLKH